MPRLDPIRDFAALADQVSVLLYDSHRDSGIDRLAARPLDFIRFLAEVGVRSGHVTKGAQRRIAMQLELIEVQDGKAVDAINNAGRAAFAARKRSKLKKDRV